MRLLAREWPSPSVVAMTDEQQLAPDEVWCPRRAEIGIASTFPGPDHWRAERESFRVGPTCSYCGSISPAKLFELIEAGAKLGPTDKNYKVYVDAPNPTPDELRCDMGSNGANHPGTTREGYWKQHKDLTAKERDIVLRGGMGRDHEPGYWHHFGPTGPKSWGKFYFQHLSEDEKRRFVDLLNAKAIAIGEPGYFYRLPYFMARQSEVAPA